MGDITRAAAAQAQIMGTGDGYTTLSGTTESLSSDIDLETTGADGVQVRVEVDFDSTPTDDVDVKLYGSLDGTDYDDTPLSAVRLDNGTDPNQITLVIRDLLHARIGAVQTGATDSHNVRMYIQSWIWNAA